VTGVLIVVLLIGVPALAFVLWPFRSGRGPAILRLPRDARQGLVEQKRQAAQSLRELAFEHEAGHISNDDYADLRARYEGEMAAVLAELDHLGPAPAPPSQAPVARSGRAWRHPLAIGTAALALLVFGIGIGAGIVRYTTPDASSMPPMPGPRPVAAAPDASAAAGGAPRTLPPEMLQGMLQAARNSLFEGRYSEAIAAYQAILKRDPKNVEAITHLGVVVALGGHADAALQSFDKALAIDPSYPAALFYRGQVLHDLKHDSAGAIRSWEQFLATDPPAEDRERVTRLITEAKASPPPTKK
jgi:tetratricopeptide (TPR) repeat protein